MQDAPQPITPRRPDSASRSRPVSDSPFSVTSVDHSTRLWTEQICVAYSQDRVSRNYSGRVEFDLSNEQCHPSRIEISEHYCGSLEHWRHLQLPLSVGLRKRLHYDQIRQLLDVNPKGRDHHRDVCFR